MNIETQKNNLETERNMLIRQMTGLGLYNFETDTFTATHEKQEQIHDTDEDADMFEEYETNSATGEILTERLRDVLDALKKIETDSYGICEITGKNIEEDRLLANPAARTCKEVMNQ